MELINDEYDCDLFMEEEEQQYCNLYQQLMAKYDNTCSIKTEYVWLSKTHIVRKAKWMVKGVCWGRLTVEGEPFKTSLGKVNVIDISVDEPFRHIGVATQLIRALLTLILKKEPDAKNEMLYIDTDTTDGFWTYMGANHLPYLSNFDKCISINTLLQ
jgi:hypothetical protein